MSHLVAIITSYRKGQIVGKEYIKDVFFNPIKDNNNNWVISEEEISQCDKTLYSWVNDLVLIEHEPIPLEIIR